MIEDPFIHAASADRKETVTDATASTTPIAAPSQRRSPASRGAATTAAAHRMGTASTNSAIRYNGTPRPSLIQNAEAPTASTATQQPRNRHPHRRSVERQSHHRQAEPAIASGIVSQRRSDG